ncbi:UDP-glucose 4-epimerase GalE [Emcibacter nanhaiensis]|uniref:UDP-glucose 4-epimerase n=1 Tax=Emcibacter nanhaiensis TaxID=1505037 RepID=A0A501PAM2_9PROT|nr:UDP-glucose 4-epimerase GalE [Emcibacter nanhaiensis]TPD57429.1 UDP-glucose 4-epimerase GalE [Emcibacter nanhaiensis]
MKILVTGGTGYIGSHTVLELLLAGHEVTVIDNLCNSSPESLRRVQNITGRNDVTFHELDIRDRDGLDKLFADHDFDAVIHFAGLKAVGESVAKPLEYYENNVGGTVTLCQAMQQAEVKTLVFSSSATVYGEPRSVPIREDFPTGGTTNPYGTSKLMIEQILEDFHRADDAWNIARLRYFNPVGAHESGRIGEDPNDIPNNLMPYITQVAVGKLRELSIFGNDYPTKDGTGVRDFIHVVDLAKGHLAALDRLARKPGLVTYNLGTGTGYSVLDMVQAFERVNGVKIPHKFTARREGDIAECYADPTLAKQEMGWQAEKTLDDMVRDAWTWQSQNPDGYK